MGLRHLSQLGHPNPGHRFRGVVCSRSTHCVGPASFPGPESRFPIGDQGSADFKSIRVVSNASLSDWLEASPVNTAN